MFRRGLAVASVLAVTASPALAQDPPAVREIRYQAVRVEGQSTIVALQKSHGADGLDAILRVNRLDLAHLRQGSTIVVPEMTAAAPSLSPFPATLPATAPSPPRLLIVSRRIQAFAAYEAGVLTRWGPVSTGRRETPTPAGLFATNWKSTLRRSTDNAEWLLPWYVNFINESGVSFHQFALPGYPASHACVRLLLPDAKWIYDWAESWVLDDQRRNVLVYGTPVLVYDDYDYGKPGPWTRLAEDPQATTVTAAELERALEPHRPTIAEWMALRRGRD